MPKPGDKVPAADGRYLPALGVTVLLMAEAEKYLFNRFGSIRSAPVPA